MISVSDARATLPQILDRVERGEEIIISRHGKPVAVVIQPDALRTRRADAAFGVALDVRRALDEARLQPLPTDGISPDDAERRVAELRTERDRD
jgi:prevent-host-death family protein